jgi:hypothetical protein
MGKYFGPLRNSDIDTFASDAFAHETHNLPRAYVGRNKFLMATIDFLITKDDDWYTRHILPWLYTEEIHVKWNIWRFNRTMMDYEPEQGVPRYVSYESESRSDSLVRRGLAFIIEHGFYKTEIGRQHYLMNLKQIVEAVHETVYFGVMHELLAAPNYYLQWQKKHGKSHSIVSNDAVNMLAEERWRFACVQKDVKGLFVLDAEIKDRMRRVGIEPTAWIFPSKMAIYASMVPEYFNEYSRGGAPATSALEVGAKRFDTFRGNRVFETRSFDTDFMAEGSIEPLVRHREIGEYYLLGDHFHDFEHGIRIFDMSRDKFHTITYDAAFDNALKTATDQEDYTHDTAAYDGPAKDTVALLCDYCVTTHSCTTILDALHAAFNNSKSAAQYANMAEANEYGKNGPGAAGATLDPTAGFSRECYEFVRKQRLRNGATLLVAHFECTITDPTGNGVYARTFGGDDDIKGGAGAGNRHDIRNLFSQTLDVDAAEAAAVSGAGVPAPGAGHFDAAHFTRIRRPFLLLPHKVMLMRPRQTYRMATAILVKGGEELGQTLHGHHDFQLTDDVIHKTHIGHYTFYSKSVVREPKNMHLAEDVYCTGYDGGENTEFMTKRTLTDTLAETVNPATASIIAMLVPTDESYKSCISIIGDLDAQGLTTRFDSGQGKYATSRVLYDSVKQQISMTPETAYSADERDEVGANGVCFRGAEHGYNGKTFSFEQRQHNTGHWGANVYDGCAPVRLGMYAHLKQL